MFGGELHIVLSRVGPGEVCPQEILGPPRLVLMQSKR